MNAPTQQPHHLLRIETRNFRGAPDGAVDLAPAGAIVQGRNGAGKTSLLSAIRACLSGVGATGDAVRTGADEASVRATTTGGYTVTRRILADGRQPAVKVETTGPVAATVKRPAEFLAAQAGHSLDPLAFFLADPARRRELVMAALPIVVSEEQLRTWDPSLPAGYDCAGHGLEVLARRHAEVYAARAAANKAAEESGRRAKEAECAVPAAVDAPSVEEAEATLGACKGVVADLEARQKAAALATARSASARARVDALRAKAEEIAARDLGTVYSADEIAGWRADLDAIDAEIEGLERQIASLRAKRASELGIIDAALARRAAQEKALADAAALRTQADELAAALDGAAPEAPTDHDLAVAAAARAAAEDLLRLARDAAHARELVALADATRAKALADQAAAQALTATVRTLQREAPAALVAASGLDGLAVSGDAITLGGVSLDGLCGAEQLSFAVDLAKRLGATAPLKVLTVDGLERVDPEHLDAFVQHCVAGGWQLFATLVERGDLVIRQLDDSVPDDLFT